MSLKFLILLILLIIINLIQSVKSSISNVPGSEANYNADLKLMQQQLLDAQSNAQIKNLYTIGVKMLKRMQIQNEQNSLNLDECYERLGKYTRLMLVNNKRRALNSDSNTNLNNNIKINSESIYVNNILNSKLNDPQASFSLLNEINFYL